ncbi:polysaccharide biosynthesis/export family protein [Flavobacterium sp.]|jgi:polysaccharide export outer membrane protein|uniref:polysaccharide biosynthesis/export family protein n=1 Tax=Flavobacterium sp. TaxID=239 RepID=UPI0037BF864D
MNRNKYINLIALFILLFLSSCASRKDIVYLQDIENDATINQALSYEPVIKCDDMLSVIVAADQPDLTIPFNLPQIQGNYQINDSQEGIKTYLVDASGFIDFPVIGKVKLAGLTRTQAKNELETKIKEYIKEPSVNLRILNYKISVLGEVNKPNTYKIASERVTLLEAISLAGDMTIYGKRSNVLVIREVDGKKTFNRVDLTNQDFISSPFYYLNQNDVVMVEPNKTKINSSVIGPNITVTISALSLLTTIAIILFR